MKVFLLLLVLSFAVGGRNFRRGKADRALVVLGVCVVVAVMLSSRRFV